ncbi:hypothetical protein NE237_027703 [Protea cynaroides]|uniref:Flavin-containing monooxygenase n=1 Tax=Protea cynaroides TaxID=273540 RepID=A0A9Q0GN06_9MAGN|nr:hypothetical protein NE237_027703 [Protea cynaroides]
MMVTGVMRDDGCEVSTSEGLDGDCWCLHGGGALYKLWEVEYCKSVEEVAWMGGMGCSTGRLTVDASRVQLITSVTPFDNEQNLQSMSENASSGPLEPRIDNMDGPLSTTSQHNSNLLLSNTEDASPGPPGFSLDTIDGTVSTSHHMVTRGPDGQTMHHGDKDTSLASSSVLAEFEDGTKLDVDVVFLATGFDGKRKLMALLPETFRSIVDDHSGIMPLYRGTIHPLIPHMVFIGYIDNVSMLHIAEMRFKWLVRLIEDQFKFPSVGKMLEQTTKEIKIMKKTTKFYKRICISTFNISHNGEIRAEMDWSSWRKIIGS